MKKTFEDATELDGYEDLRPDDQAKIVKAWQDGHVADEDIPLTARKPVDEEGEEKEKPKKAKRAPAKKKAPKVRSLLSNGYTLLFNRGIYLQKTDDDAENDEEEEEEKPKKKRAPAKKKAEPKEKPAPKKRASKKKKEVGVFFFYRLLPFVTSFHLGV